MAENGDLRNLIKKNMMSGNSRKRRSTWDSKEENQTSAQSTEHGAWQKRESYPRHHGRDPKPYDIEPDNAMKSRDSPKWLSREQSPRKSDHRDAKRDSYDILRSRRSADVAKSYPVSPRNRGPGRKNHIRSPEGTWDRPHRRSRSRSWSRGRVRVRAGSRSPSRGRNRSRSLSRGRERDKGYGRSRSPLNDYRRDPHGGLNDRRSGFGAPPPQVRNFTAGNGRRGSQDRFLHSDNPKPRDGGRPDRDHTERWGMRGERGGSRYDVEREEPARKSNPTVCNDFLNGRCRRGSSCRFSHDTGGDNSQERQHYLAPCKFFMMGNCSRSNCKFAHDGPMQDDREMVPRNDRRDRDYSSIQDDRDMTSRVDRRDRDYGSKNKRWNGPTWEDAEKSSSLSVVKDGGWDGPIYDGVAGGSDVGRTGGRGNSAIENTEASKNKTWNGPTWEDAEKSNSLSVVKNGGWDGPIYDGVAGGSDVGRTGGWGNSGIENAEVTNRIMAERDNCDELNHLEDETKIWAASGSHDADTNIPGSEALKEITSVEPRSTLDSKKYHTPYDFSELTSTVTHSVLPENPQLYSKTEENKYVARGFHTDNDGNVYANANQPTPLPGGDFDRQSDTCGLPSQQFGGISQGQLDFPVRHNVDFNGPVHANISPFDAQNSVVAQHEHPVKPIVSMPQMIEHKPVQIPNLPPSLSEKFVNELPRLYEALNPRRPAEPVSSIPDYMNPFPPASSINIQPDHTSIYQIRNGDAIESKKLDNINQHPGLPSDFIALNGGSLNNNHMASLPSQQKMIPKPVLEETSKPTAEKPNQEPENNGAGNVEAETNIGDGADWKEEKAMRLFKNSLVEFVKDILKPKWKEGGMTKDVYKAVVKKVVDKVTSATQGVNIPSTQAKLDQYLQSSKPKLAKLVEAYVERYAKTS